MPSVGTLTKRFEMVVNNDEPIEDETKKTNVIQIQVDRINGCGRG